MDTKFASNYENHNIEHAGNQAENLDQVDANSQDTIGDQIERKEIVVKLNEKYAVIMVGGKCRIIQEYVDPVFNRHDISILGVPDFKNFHANMLFYPEGKEKPISHAKLWLTSKNRRQYDGIVFKPPKAGDTDPDEGQYYNLWRGFGVEPKKGDWQLFREHILDNICNGNESHFRWLMKWLARTVQDPGGERPGVAVVLMGKRGTGKSIFARMLRPIFGQHFLHLANQKYLTGNFNSHLKDKLVVFCDEGFWGSNRSDEGVLKALITDDKIRIL